MKHLFTAIACCLAVVCLGQGTTIHEYPWNPDWDNDNFVGSSDLTGFLSAYGSEFGNPPEPCDYDGTPLEDWIFGVVNGTVICDSIWFEMELHDISTYYPVGCPDAVSDTAVFADYGTLYPSEHSNCSFGIPTLLSFIGLGQFNAQLNFAFYYDSVDGEYNAGFTIGSLSGLGFFADGFFGGGSTCVWTAPFSLPLPSEWTLNEDGIQINYAWTPNQWPYYANYLHILPYWHYAE